MKRLFAFALCSAIVAVAFAQPDNSVWPQFRANNSKTGAVQAPGRATSLAWTLDLQPDPGNPLSVIPSPGGISLAENGDLYFKSHDDTGAHVYRIDADTGVVLAQSVDLSGALGGYGGVAVGVDEVYVTIHPGAQIVVLDKLTLAVLRTYSDPAFVGLRGTPLISDLTNMNGNYTLYVADRNGAAIHAVDAATGAIMWTYPVLAESIFNQLGPMWVTPGNRQAIAHFGNTSVAGGTALQDNGDGTFTVLWDLAGPDSFNWWGTGAMSADGQRIYVATFNDNNADSLWGISVADGSIAWSFPGQDPGGAGPLNFFGRPAVVGNRIYCGGQDGVIAAYDDNVNSATLVWTYRDFIGEHTSISAVTDPVSGDTYIYAVKQGDTGAGVPGKLIVLRDEGATFSLVFETDLGGTMLATLFSNNSAMLDANGNLYIAGGNSNGDPGVNPGAVYKFRPCICGDANCDGLFNGGDIDPFFLALGDPAAWEAQFPGCDIVCAADVNHDGSVNGGDIDPFFFALGKGGCP